MNISDPESSPAAIIYGRVSTDKQHDSLDLQEKLAAEYVIESGFSLHPAGAGLFLDEAQSGGKPFHERPAAQRLLAALKAHPEIKHVVIAKTDRLDRTLLSGLLVVKALTGLGVSIHILDFMDRRLRTDDPQQMAFFQMSLVFAQLELATITARIRQRVKENFSQYLLIGTPPYGYDVVKYGEKFNPKTGKTRALYRLVPNYAEQAVIRRIAYMRDDLKLSYARIATKLNADGVPTKTPKGTRIKLRNAQNGQPEQWTVTSGLWQAGNVEGVLNSKHSLRILGEEPPTEQAQAA